MTEEFQALSEREEVLFRARTNLEIEYKKLAEQARLAKGSLRHGAARVPYLEFKKMVGLVENLKFKIKKINMELMPIQKKMGELRRLNGHLATAGIQKDKLQNFIEVAKEILPEETYYRILQMAEGRGKGGSHGLD